MISRPTIYNLKPLHLIGIHENNPCQMWRNEGLVKRFRLTSCLGLASLQPG